MNKQEAKKMGAWISLLGGSCFVAGSLAAVYVAFCMPEGQVKPVLTWLGRIMAYAKFNK